MEKKEINIDNSMSRKITILLYIVSIIRGNLHFDNCLLLEEGLCRCEGELSRDRI